MTKEELVEKFTQLLAECSEAKIHVAFIGLLHDNPKDWEDCNKLLFSNMAKPLLSEVLGSTIVDCNEERLQ